MMAAQHADCKPLFLVGLAGLINLGFARSLCAWVAYVGYDMRVQLRYTSATIKCNGFADVGIGLGA